jgi:glutathione S-transferase
MEPFVVWGPELSPFLLKLEAMLAWHGVPWRRLPRDGSRLENLRMARSIARAVKRRDVLRPPSNDPLDEYPVVPFLRTPDGQLLYDTSALAGWLDARSQRSPLVPADPAVRFVASLIDEAFDEFGLYMVHHNRWTLAAADNGDPGRRLAREYAKLLPPGAGAVFARWFHARQVRRLPYLFSVAPDGYRVDGLARHRTPPSHRGFPPTHDILDEAWTRYLAAVEILLREQPFLFGETFTIADASAYGQLSMNLTDELAARRLRELAPRTFDWLVSIREGRHRRDAAAAPILTERLAPLLSAILDTFVPLMRDNAAACTKLLAAGARRFNERAFDAGEGLFDGSLLGRPYRHVAKTFQLRSWRDLVHLWDRTGGNARREVQCLLPGRDLAAEFRLGPA